MMITEMTAAEQCTPISTSVDRYGHNCKLASRTPHVPCAPHGRTRQVWIVKGGLLCLHEKEAQHQHWHQHMQIALADFAATISLHCLSSYDFQAQLTIPQHLHWHK